MRAAPGRSDLDGRRLYLCTPDRPDLERFVAACIRGGVDVVQLRDKELGGRALLDAGRRVRLVCADLGVPFVMNDRPDLALEIGADGVHVGQDDVPVSLARAILGPDAIVGLSTHAQGDLDEAMTADVDYISAGPVVPTPTKPGRQGTGMAYVAAAVRRAPGPVFVTGGVDPHSVPALVAAGVRHFVVVRWLTTSDDPFAAAHRVRRAIDEALAGADDKAMSLAGGDGGDGGDGGPDAMEGDGPVDPTEPRPRTTRGAARAV